MFWKRASSPTWSLALRLAVWYAFLCLVVIVFMLGLLDWLLARGLEQDDDERLADRIRIVRALLGGPDGVEEAKEEIEFEAHGLSGERIYTRIVDVGGNVVAETPRMAAAMPRKVFAGLTMSTDDTAHAQDIRSANHVFRGMVGEGPSVVIQVGMGRAHDRQLLARYRVQAGLVAGLVLVTFSVIGHRIARRGLRPLQNIAREAGHVGSSTLAQRVTTDGLPQELLGVGLAINDMLDRIDEAFSRLTQFSADLAHELRTPVTALRGTLEVALYQGRSPAEYQEVLGSCLEDCTRLAKIVDELLFLARAERPAATIERETVQVRRELEVIAEFYEAPCADARVPLAVRVAPDLSAALDRALLQRALGNLIENAIAHTAPGGTISVTASRLDGKLQVDVTDTGSGIAAEHMTRVFDRFYRVEPSRSTRSASTGLGLAIVKQIAILHGGDVAIDSTIGHGTRVTLTFPA